MGVLFVNLQLDTGDFTQKIIDHTYFVREVDIVLDPQIVIVTL